MSTEPKFPGLRLLQAGEILQAGDRSLVKGGDIDPIPTPDFLFGFAVTEVDMNNYYRPIPATPAPESPAPAEGWTGRKCPACKGSGEDNDGRNCSACAGTGDEYGKPIMRDVCDSCGEHYGDHASADDACPSIRKKYTRWTPAPVDIGTGSETSPEPSAQYRDLVEGETIKAGDEVWAYGRGPWESVSAEAIGNLYMAHYPGRPTSSHRMRRLVEDKALETSPDAGASLREALGRVQAVAHQAAYDAGVGASVANAVRVECDEILSLLDAKRPAEQREAEQIPHPVAEAEQSPQPAGGLREAFYGAFSLGWDACRAAAGPDFKENLQHLRLVRGVDECWREFQNSHAEAKSSQDRERIEAALEIIHIHQDDDARTVGPETTIRMIRELLEGEIGEEGPAAQPARRAEPDPSSTESLRTVIAKALDAVECRCYAAGINILHAALAQAPTRKRLIVESPDAECSRREAQP